MNPPPIWMTITMLSGLLLLFAGGMYYTFVGPHPDASGSIQENVLSPLFWTDHPGISWAVIGAVLVIMTYIALSRFETSDRAQNTSTQTTPRTWFLKVKTRLSRGDKPRQYR
jgi:membrane protein implicated in regulation of membrane protease activity